MSFFCLIFLLQIVESGIIVFIFIFAVIFIMDRFLKLQLILSDLSREDLYSTEITPKANLSLSHLKIIKISI